jgi:hypothetical protein
MNNSSGRDIVKWTYLNTIFFMNFYDALERNNNQTIENFFSDFCNRNQVSGIFHCKNQGVIINLLRDLLIYINQNCKEDVNKLELNYLNKFAPVPENQKEFLRYLRNAVAHGTYEIIANTHTYEFWNPKKQWKISIQHGDLGMFCTELYSKFVALR